MIQPPALEYRDPFERWQRIADLLRMAVVSTRVVNMVAPLNLILVGPPGDGKTEMLMRAQTLAHTMVLSDATYYGVMHFAGLVRDREKSALIIPDLASIVGRKSEVARQAIGNLASLCAEGLHRTAVGRQMRDFRGARASVLTAIASDELDDHAVILSQNAFLSRFFLCDFDLSLPELEAMFRRHTEGRRELLRPLWAVPPRKKAVSLPMRHVDIPSRYDEVGIHWWKELRAHRPDMFYGFRTGHAIRSLFQAAAYLREKDTVARRDVEAVEQILPIVFQQIQTIRTQGTKT